MHLQGGDIRQGVTLDGGDMGNGTMTDTKREQFFIQNNEDKEYKIETDDTSYGHITTQQSQPLVKVTTSPNNWIFPLVCSAPRLLVSLAQNNDITG